MSGHYVLPAGNAMLEALARLGEALGYGVQPEFMLPDSSRPVDLGWFAAGDRSVPLFVFEVESKARREMAANPLKIFAKPTVHFVKPLFVFHVVVGGGGRSRYIQDLEQQYG